MKHLGYELSSEKQDQPVRAENEEAVLDGILQ
jgi:hypothetical protein